METLSDERLVEFTGRVDNKVIFITGAAKGIGKEIAVVFAKHGAKVVITDVDESAAQATAAEIAGGGKETLALKCNVKEWDDQVSAFEAALAKFGRIDIVVANAGIPEQTRLMHVQLGEDGKPVKPALPTLDVNLIGTLYTVHLAQHYVAQGPRQEGDVKAIVIMSSMGAYYQTPGTTTYGTAKAGLTGLARSLEPFNTKAGVRMALIHPWFADTDMARGALPILAGLPLTPVSRIANAVLRSATDPDFTTSCSGYLLLDDGPVVQVTSDHIMEGVHPMLTKGIYAELKNRFMKAYKLVD